MKTDLMSAFEPMDRNSMEKLVSEVKETLATEVDLMKKSSLKAVDIWKIEKSKKYASRRFARKNNHIPFI